MYIKASHELTHHNIPTSVNDRPFQPALTYLPCPLLTPSQRWLQRTFCTAPCRSCLHFTADTLTLLVWLAFPRNIMPVGICLMILVAMYVSDASDRIHLIRVPMSPTGQSLSRSETMDLSRTLAMRPMQQF